MRWTRTMLTAAVALLAAAPAVPAAAAPPDTRITSAPPGPSNDVHPTFSFAAEPPEDAAFTCRHVFPEGGEETVSCESEFQLRDLVDGTHRLEVVASNADGPDPTPAVHMWVVDTIAPETTITSATVQAKTATFGYSSDEPGTFECALDTDAFGACPASYTGLADGAHQFRVRAVDMAGNFDDTPASHSFVVETEPETTITSPPPPSPTNSVHATFTFTSDDPDASFTCRHVFPDGSDEVFTGCLTEFTVRDLVDGTHSFEVFATDAAGNSDQTPATQTWTVDTVAPAPPAIDSPPDGAVLRETAVTLTGTTVEAADVAIFDNGRPAGPAELAGGAWSLTLDRLAVGRHRFTAVATDEAGNESQASAPRTVFVHPAGPPVALTGGPPSFAFSSPEPGATFLCRLTPGDGGMTPCAPPRTYGALPDGTYTFIVAARGVDGVVGPEVRHTFAVAASAPEEPDVAAPPLPFVPAPVALPAARPVLVPEFRRDVVVRPVSGRVLVRRPGAGEFVVLAATQHVPLGSEIDARRGRIQLTAEPAQGRPTQRAVFYGGIFAVTQTARTVDLRLTQRLAPCRPVRRGSAALPTSRRMWGDGRGRFRITGRYSQSTVRGTIWMVQDSCAGTLTRVSQGVVAVRDKTLRKTVLVRKGKSYLARPRV